MDNNQCEKSNKQKIKISCADIIGLLTLVIAVSALFFTVKTYIYTFQPQRDPHSVNDLEKAYTHDLESQLTLADQYLENKDYTQSLYWYRKSTEQEGEHLQRVYNNIGYIYATNPMHNSFDTDYIANAYLAFQTAFELGSHKALRNMYILLKSNPPATFHNIQYHRVLQKTEDQLKAWNEFDTELEMYTTGWELVGRTDGMDELAALMQSSDEAYVSFARSTEIVHDRDRNTVYIVTYYDVYKQVDKPEAPEYIKLLSREK